MKNKSTTLLGIGNPLKFTPKQVAKDIERNVNYAYEQGLKTKEKETKRKCCSFNCKRKVTQEEHFGMDATAYYCDKHFKQQIEEMK